ncbi:hypothetical protein Lepto7375DRAFT_2535 [Leptolyngbya sp. PCC 7375]|nr:hypothetical protein Lepto7375DRAFT_2535 [Leptolyngbya sp. PCC 7375]
MITKRNKFLCSLYIQFRGNLPLIGLITAVSTIFLGKVVFIHLWYDVPIDQLTRDINAIGRIPAYAGFLSQIGLFCWAASAMLCFFSANIIKTNGNHHKIGQFLLASTLLTLILGLDDAFLLHEKVLPKLGIPEGVTYASYGGLLLFYLFRFHKLILKTDYTLIAISLAFFGLSYTLDFVLDIVYPAAPIPLLTSGQISYLLEDGAKFIGIISWLVYCFQIGKYSIRVSAAKPNIELQAYSTDIEKQPAKYKDIHIYKER